MRKNLYIIFCLFLILITSCSSWSSHNKPSLIKETRVGDYTLTCYQIEVEMIRMSRMVQEKYIERDKRNEVNAAYIVVGTFIFWPTYFCMNVSSVEKKEIESIRLRFKRLSDLAVEKKCDIYVEME